MPTREFRTDLPASLDRAWAFHLDVTKALPLLSPPGSDVRIISADLPARVGQRIEMTVRGPVGVRLRWIARIVEFSPPTDMSNGREAQFTDIQEAGPFAHWRHEHRLIEISAQETTLIDRIDYQVRFGLLGRFANWLFVARQLHAMFDHRHRVTKVALGSS